MKPGPRHRWSTEKPQVHPLCQGNEPQDHQLAARHRGPSRQQALHLALARASCNLTLGPDSGAGPEPSPLQALGPPVTLVPLGPGLRPTAAADSTQKQGHIT